MKNLLAGAKLLFVSILLCLSPGISAQLTGIKTIPGDYATISLAVAALNSSGVGNGGVTFNVAANYTETISATISITTTGTAANSIIFQKDPATTGANPLITAYTAGVGTPATAVQDGIWRFVGVDYITIDGIDLKDNPVNTANPATMEYGYALYKASPSDGCQFVTIKNCTVTLNNVNNVLGSAPMADGSTGIAVMNALSTSATTQVTPTAGGTNSNNKFYSNIIQNCNTGIALIGYAAPSPFTLADAGNDIGGSLPATGNTIINFGGASAAANPAVAIRTLAQYGLNVSYNVINNNNGSGTNHPNALRGIYINSAASANATITYNTVTVKGGGTTQPVTAIENAAGSTPAVNTISISNNTIKNCTYASATTGSLYGIYNYGSPATLNISSDTINNNSSAASTTGVFYEIYNNGAASAVSITGNKLTGNVTAASTGAFAGIYNAAATPVLNINSNTFGGDSTSTVTGLRYFIYNSGAATNTININANNIGTSASPAIKFSAGNSAAQVFIYNKSGGTASALSISNNNFYNILYLTAGTGSNTYLQNSAATLSQAINSNTFNNLNVNTSGSITFMSNSVAVSATGTQNVNSNAINGTFIKAASGGSVTLFTSTASSLAGSIINNNNNNFSNITVSGTTSVAGWLNTDAGNSTKTIQNNTFNNWTGGTGSITALSVNITGANNATTGNTITNISSTGSITGIATAAGKDNVYSNTINGLASTGSGSITVTGINVTAGTLKNIYLNTIYNLQGNTVTTGSVRGILVSGGTAVNVFQNTVYTLLANALTTGTVSGVWISAGTTVIAYRNKIYDLSSSGGSISTGIVNGIEVSGSAVSTVTVRNNLVGDIRATAASATDPVRGMSLISTGLTSMVNVYNNTINLNAISTGANFGSSGIYHTTNATATTATLDLRNNIINNTCVPTGTGITVAFRRSTTTLTNYASASNNNLFYAGIATTKKLLFYDGTNSDQFLSTYKSRVAARDAQSVTEDLTGTFKFISTIGSSASFLHIDSTKATQAESGGVSIASVTNDFDGQTRQGITGYSGTGTAPDIGADEFEGIKSPAFSGTYNVGSGQTYTSLTSAGGLFAGINSLGLSGNVVVNITSDITEDGTNVLYQWVEKGVGNYTLTLQPNASSARLISGNVLTAMISFNGAKRVTIDGSNGTTTNYLTFRNTNTTGTTGSAFTFINGTTNNTIKYCNIEAYANATNGVMLFGASTVAGGNSNNTISNCSINATVGANSGNVSIYSGGTAGNENATNTFINNKIYNYRDRAIDVAATGSQGWIISGNSCYNGDVSGAAYIAASTLHGIRVLGGSGYTISNNYIGGNAALASGTIANYSSAGILSFQGILLTTSSATPVSNITGNIIADISVSAVPVSGTSANVFIGIETNGSGINIGGILPGNGNIVGSNTINGSVAVNTNTTSSAYGSIIKGINCNSTGGLVIGNQVGGIDINNAGSSPGASVFNGIYINNATAPSQVNNNLVGSNGTGAAANSIRVISASTSTTTLLTGISIGSSVISAVQVDSNIVKNISFLNSATPVISPGGFYGISSAAAGTATVTITNNTVTKDSIANYSSGLFYGIYNSGAPSIITINNNTIIGNSSNSATGLYAAIINSGAAAIAININNNNIGNSTLPAFTFNAVNSGTQIFINNTGGASTAALSISNNTFQNINYLAAGTGNMLFIQNAATTLSQAINGNTFNNLSLNTAGNTTFISNTGTVAAGGTQNVNNNSIVTAFTKKAGGSLTLFTSTATSVAGSTSNNNNNNFSNITVLAGTTIAGWLNTDAGASLKMIQNNTFTNWVGGTASITAMFVNIAGANNATSGNLINNISSAGSITGIMTGAGNDNIFSNTINTLSTTGAFSVTGISVTPGGITKNIYKNKIYDLSGSNAGSTVNGILVNGDTTVNIFNNLVGDLKTPAGSASDPVRGISITSSVAPSAVNVYYNTIYLNATSTGAVFGTTGIYQTAGLTANTAALSLRNNSITNTSSIKGAAYTVAFRRSGASLLNYASTSNNNLFYAGTPGPTKLLYWDGGNGDQTLANYKTRVAIPRDSASITEDITSKFLSVSGSSPVFLHMNSTLPSGIESGGVNITGYTDDFDGQIRAGNSGYSGNSTLPDIGADEIFGIETIPPAITYTLLTSTTLTTNRDLTGVSISDASGINTASGTKPRIYFKRSTDANVWLDNSPSSNGWKYKEANNTTSPYSFTIDYSLLNGGAAVTAGVIQYFIVAQDNATTANVAINSGTFSAVPSSVALASTAFPITGVINSYNIAFAGVYNVGASEIFTSLTRADGLFASINNAGLMGNAIFNITSNLNEDGTNALNQWNELGAGNYTLTIQPDAAALRTVSGNAAGGLIRLNGADRVTIDGSNGGSGKFLSFKNTNTAGTTGTAFTFINGATNNSVKNCDAQAFDDATDGVILFSTSTVAGGNSSNTIDNCTINATVTGNTGNAAIYSAGTPGNENASNTISGNSIYGYKDRGLDINSSGSTAWVISGNSFYNGNVSGAINYASSSALHGIRVLGGAGYSILNNYVGGSTNLASGANALYSSTLGNISFQGILLTTSSASPASNIKGNTIAAISISSIPTAAVSNAFTGIETSGSGINIGGGISSDGNTIGSLTSNASILVTTSAASASDSTNITGINFASSGGIISNNHVSGFDISNIGTTPAPAVFQGIYINNALAPSQVNNNIIGSTSTSGSIRVLAASAATATTLTGIGIGPAVNSTLQVNNNRIENISNLSTTSSGSFTGINNASSLSSAAITISSDTIQYITSAANAGSGSAVYAAIKSSSASTISNNIINTIVLSSTGINAQTNGINVSGAYTNTISGNIILNLSTASNKETAVAETGNPSGSNIAGILNTATVAGQIITNNTLSGFSATSNAGINSVVTGIGINASVSGSIYNNKISSFTNSATGAAPAICGIMAAGGSFNVYNNSIKISNASNTNAVKVYGINHSASGNWNYYFNSVNISGNASGARSSAFIRTINSPLLLRDNVFINSRTGAGSNYAISNLVSPASANWAASASDYNNLYSSNPATTGEWGAGNNQTFAQWQASSNSGAHSVNKPVSFITSLYDLQPDSAANCAMSNAGTPITSPVNITADLYSNARNGVTPDLGAYEFNYSVFIITALDDAQVCSGDSLTLTVNPGLATGPLYSWINPSNIMLSSAQNPTVLPIAGQYKITVTDVSGCSVTDSALISVNQRPTAAITAQASLCDSGYVNINIAVTGTGTILGTLSNGDIFSGTAPLIVVAENVTSTTSFSITDLSDSTCTSIAADIPDTVTIAVTHKGDWLGLTSNWHDPVNWCGGILPTPSADVTIPAGTAKMPLITDSVLCNNLIINTGDTLTISAAGTLNIGGTLANSGTFNDNGTTNFNGNAGQQSFSGVTTFNNLMINNTNSLILPAAITVKNNVAILNGILNANNFNITTGGSWINNVSASAFTAGTATAIFNGTTEQAIGGSFATTFNNLTIVNAGGGVNLNVNTSINGNLSVTTGTLNLAAFTANRVTSGGTLTVSNNATIKIGGANTYPANYATSALSSGGTIEYSGTNQAVANRTYGNLSLSSSGGAVIKTFPAGALAVTGNLSSTAGAGASVSFTAASNITVGKNVIVGTSATFNGGSFSHSMDTVTVQNGGTLTAANSILKIKGAIINNGIFDVSNGTIEMNGLAPQTIAANTFTNNVIANLVISNTIALAGEDSITGILSFGANSKSFNTGGFLTLKSNLAGTARLADITNGGTLSGNTISGNVKIERFVLARRGWRFLTAPINASGAQTINQAWQEGQTSGNQVQAYGTQITGGALTDGFDQSPSNTSSLRVFKNSANAWLNVSSTNNPITDSAGYMLFVRGDRSIDLTKGAAALPTNTTLRSTGQLKTGNQTYTIAATGFTVVGNPYPSPIDFHQITKSNVQDNFYLWDPKISGTSGVGSFVNISWNGGSYDITPSSGGSGLTQYIQSGSAFLVRSMNGTSAGTMIIKETDKSSTPNVNANRVAGNSTATLKTSLYSVNTDSTTSLADGTLNSFAAMYSDNIDEYDAVKLNNFSESLSSQRKGVLLVTERRQPLSSSDTIFLNMQQMKVKSYQYVFIAEKFSPNLTAYLEDTYLHTAAPLNLNGKTVIGFNVINVPGSWNADRFSIIFKQSRLLPVTFKSITAFAQNENIKVEWKANNEGNIKQYHIERSSDGVHFIRLNTVAAKGNINNTSTYNWLDESVLDGNNFYRVKSESHNGEYQYSAVIKVYMGAKNNQITIYPNPVLNNTISMQFKNELAGEYSIQLFNAAGELMFSKKIQHMPENSAENIPLKKGLSNGIYKLQIIKPNKKIEINKLLL